MRPLVDLGREMAVDDPGENVETGERFGAIELAGLEARGGDRPILTSAVRSGEQRFLAIESDGADCAPDDIGPLSMA